MPTMNSDKIINRGGLHTLYELRICCSSVACSDGRPLPRDSSSLTYHSVQNSAKCIHSLEKYTVNGFYHVIILSDHRSILLQ